MSENVKRWYVYNGELLSGDEYDPATDDENLYVPVVFGPDYDALLAERDALREAGEKLADAVEALTPYIPWRDYRENADKAIAAWRAATGRKESHERNNYS